MHAEAQVTYILIIICYKKKLTDFTTLTLGRFKTEDLGKARFIFSKGTAYKYVRTSEKSYLKVCLCFDNPRWLAMYIPSPVLGRALRETSLHAGQRHFHAKNEHLEEKTLPFHMEKVEAGGAKASRVGHASAETTQHSSPGRSAPTLE